MQSINCQQESKNITHWIRKVFDESGMQIVVIGMSGGIDSSLSCTLLVQAIGRERVVPILLPYGSSGDEGVIDAKLVLEHLGIPKEQVRVIDIKKGVDAITPGLPRSARNDGNNVRQGNIMARVRMIYLFDTAKEVRGLVCGTENKSEHYLGYFTRFGDEASDIEPIRYLYKTQVWEMARYLKIPDKVIIKAPTAGLWDGQTDESELGFSYQQADEILGYFMDEKLSAGEIIKKGIDTALVEKVLQRVKNNEFKHHLPFVYNVSR